MVVVTHVSQLHQSKQRRLPKGNDERKVSGFFLNDAFKTLQFRNVILTEC